MTDRRRFTLVEVLMVMVLIGVLMGILLPAIGKVREKAKIARARGEMKALVMAVNEYQSTYGYLPVPQSKASTPVDTRLNDTEYGKLIGDLSCTTDAAPTPNKRKNPRKIQMLDVTVGGHYEDPWQKRYQIAFDANYDDEVDKDQVAGLVKDVYAPVVVWSLGPDNKQDTSNTANDAKDNKDNVYSLETKWNPGSGHEPKK